MEETTVTVLIQSVHDRDTGRESLTQRAEGTLRQRGTGWLLTWQEGEDSGMGSTRTTFRLEDGKATLTRSGEITSHMVFHPGNPHTSVYETPYGSLPLTLHTLRLEGELTGQGGRIFIHYQMELGGGSAGETRMRLTVKAKENGYDR